MWQAEEKQENFDVNKRNQGNCLALMRPVGKAKTSGVLIQRSLKKNMA